MRPTLIAAVPLFAGLIALPAGAQVSARIHLDIPIGRQGPVVYGAPRQQLIVREYDSNIFGDWDRYYDEWIPETVYYYDGYYYDYPIVAYAEPILIYRYRNQRFFAPRQREFITWQQRYRVNDYRRDFGRTFWPTQRDNRQYQPQRDDRNGRDGRDFRPAQPQRDDRNGRDFHPAQPQRDDRNGRDIRPAQPQRDGRDGRDVRPAQPPQVDRGGRDGRDMGRPAQPQRDERGGGRAGGPPSRDAGRSRPRPH